MKHRLKVDGVIIAGLTIATIGMFFVPPIYWVQEFVRIPFLFLGLLLIQKGMFIRMASRGHKKTLSPQGQGLAKTGFYAYTRNPMYLGSFSAGLGVAMIVWPWWLLPIFAWLFYLRFSPQIAWEEKHLENSFGQKYIDYCREVPRFFPSIKSMLRINKRRECPWRELWSTKEKYGVFLLPIAALVLSMVLEFRISGALSFGKEILTYLLAVIVFWIHLYIEYNKKHEENSK